jgi:hypothetical protein
VTTAQPLSHSRKAWQLVIPGVIECLLEHVFITLSEKHFYSYFRTVQTWITYVFYFLIFITAVFGNIEISGRLNSVIRV